MQPISAKTNFAENVDSIATNLQVGSIAPHGEALMFAWAKGNEKFYSVFDKNLDQIGGNNLSLGDASYTAHMSLAAQSGGDAMLFNQNLTSTTYDFIEVTQSGPATITENADVSTVILDVNATDAENDTLQYSVTGTDAALVTIDTDDGEVRLNAPADYETKSSYSFTVNVSDGELTDSQDVTVDVVDVTEPNIISQLTSGYSMRDVEVAPDLDNDGMNELIVHRGTSATDRQMYAIQSDLISNFQVTNIDTISSNSVLSVSGLERAPRPELHSKFVGDFNSDGIPDLALGDHDISTDGFSRNGRVYLFSGSELVSQHGSTTAESLISSNGMKFYGEKNGDYLGLGTNTMEDRRGNDTELSLLLTASERSTTLYATTNKGDLNQINLSGLTQIYDQNGPGASISIGGLDAFRNRIEGISPGDGFPGRSHPIGDLNSDNVDDLLLLPNGNYSQAWFVSGADLLDGYSFNLQDGSAGDGFDVSLSSFNPLGAFSMEDINADQSRDGVIFTRFYDPGSGVTGGTIFVLKSGNFFANASSPDQWSADGHITINSSQGIYLSDATEIPDISGDGVSEIAFGTHSSTSADKTGIYIIYSDFLTSAAGDYNMESLSSDQMSFVPTSTALLDLEAGNFDTDASPELVVTTEDGQNVYVVNMDEFGSWSGGDLF